MVTNNEVSTMQTIDYTQPETQESLKEMLRANVLSVEFTKVNGESRKMECTLDPELLPASSETTKAPRAAPASSLAVFDVQQNAWRSFRWDSVISVTPCHS